MPDIEEHGYCAKCLTRIPDMMQPEVDCPKCGQEIQSDEDWLAEEELVKKRVDDDAEYKRAIADGLIRRSP